ncbi:MAG: MFS transporter [Rhodospirillaceae bacterium]|nr:MFS transporter [Rhodospirillaceae bacterium]
MGRSTMTVLVSGVLVLVLAMGVRQSFGVFLTPITMDLETGRQAFGLAIAIQNLLWGVAQPFTGAIADRFGAAWVLAAGAVLYAAGLVLTTVSSGPLHLDLTLGVLIGLALSGCTYVTVLGALGRIVPPERRSTAFGLCTAAGSFGMFAVVPGAQWLLDSFDWQNALLILALSMSVLLGLSLGMRPADRALARSAGGKQHQTLGAAVREAGRHDGYWLLNAGFFVCGFHVAFVATHLPSYLADNRMDPAVSAWALAMIGLFNIFGSYLFGALGLRFRQKYLLSVLYLARAGVIGLFLVLPLTPFTAIAFGSGIGFLWLGTVPLTSGLVARVFGVQYLSMLYGFVFMFHQIGAFLGAWGGGWAYDALGSYDLIWLASIALALFAALVHLPIRDAPVARLAEAGT